MLNKLKDIQKLHSLTKVYLIGITVIAVLVSVSSIWMSYQFAEAQREKIYVLDQGKSLILALEQDIRQSRPAEAKAHVQRFHELFFTLTPNMSSIENNVNKALQLSDDSLFLIYAIMASQFESLRDPFIIMFTVPLSIIGVIWAFILTGTTLSAVTFVGIIMLLGIVVNNGIVLVDYTNLLRGRGYTIIEAIKEGGRSRLRPVLMTAITTIIGMVPMALNNGAGSEIWKPLGITVIGGLTVATLVTLLLIPAIYAIMHTREMIKEAKAAKAAAEGGAK